MGPSTSPSEHVIEPLSELRLDVRYSSARFTDSVRCISSKIPVRLPLVSSLDMCIYIYRERERYIHLLLSLSLSLYVYTYIYIYTHMYIERERERDY